MTSLQQISQMTAARQLADAAAALQKLVRKKDKAPVDWETAMRMAASLGDLDTALAAAKNWLAAAPGDPRRQIAVIDGLGAVAKHQDAARLARDLQHKPNAAADGYYLEGVFQARLGNRDDALLLFRRALARNPEHTPAWEQIALLGGYQDFDADLHTMQRLTDRIKAPERLIPLYYALGRAFDHADDADKAFQCISTGAALREKLSPFEPQAQLRYLQRLSATFSPERIDRLQNERGGEGVVFILSAPRSGSTLIEQILAAADPVTPTGEHTLLRLATLRLGSMEPPDMATADQFKNSDWRKIAQSYLTAIRKRFGASKLYTDKTIINYYYAGLIKILFPDAKLVWCRRDPRDAAWSCFRSRISANLWTQKLENCVEFLQAHNRLCQYWADLYGANFASAPYETLVTDADAATAALFDHAGAERPRDWARFYENKNAVATASLAQVRQPLNADAVGSWRRYEKHLAPVYDKYFR